MQRKTIPRRHGASKEVEVRRFFKILEFIVERLTEGIDS